MAAAVTTLTTSRLEAFSDGVFAIAITLLVLDIGVPSSRQGQLWGDLGRLWPQYGAYAISFVTIGVMWANHHNLMHVVGRADQALVFLNLVVLAVVAFIPFPTAVLASYIQNHAGNPGGGRAGGGSNAQAAIGLYGLTMIALAIAFTLVWRHLHRTSAIVAKHAPVGLVRRELIRSASGTAVYTVATAVDLVAPAVSLALYAALVLVFAAAAARNRLDEPGGVS